MSKAQIVSYFFPSIIPLRAYHWVIESEVGGESAVADGLMVSKISYLLEWQATFFDDNFLGQKVHKYFWEQWEWLASHAPNTSVENFMEPWKCQARGTSTLGPIAGEII